MQEYPVSKSYSIVFGAVFFFGGIVLAWYAVHSDTLVLLVPAMIFVTLGVSMYVLTGRLRITIDEEEITKFDGFKTRSVLLKEIDGYRTGKDNLFEVVAKDGATISIPNTIERRDELLDWIKEKYADVDQRQNTAATEELLENENFGASREDRKAKLANAQLVSGVATGLAIALGAWAIFSDSYWELAMTALFLVPWAAIYLVWSYKGLLKLSSSKKSPYPSIFIPFFVSILTALIETIGYRLYGFPSSAWLILLAGTLALTLVALAAMRVALDTGNKAGGIAVVIIFSGLYTWNLLVYSNCHYDGSVPQVMHAEVTAKRTTTGRSTSYYLMLGPWGQYAVGKEVSVGKSFYNNITIGDSVNIRLRKGKWNIPWYTIARDAVVISPRKAAAAARLPAVGDRSPGYPAGVLSADRYGK